MQPSATPRFSVCIYCGSSIGTDPHFSAVAAQIGRWIGAQGGQLVFGGGRAGLMGVVADATLAAGGRVIGVIPQALVDREHAHLGCTELLVVDTMHERKRLMAEHADFFIALPGGIGTFEEFFETWTWRQLGYHDKPVGLLNLDGYYDELMAFIHHAVRCGFMQLRQMSLIEIHADWRVLMQSLRRASDRPRPGA